MIFPFPFPCFHLDSHLPVLSAIQHSNFRSSFERQSRQHVVLVHPPRGCSSQCSRATLSKPRRLPSSSKCTTYIFPSRSFPVQWTFSFLCARHHESCPWTVSLIVSLLLSSADFKSRPELKVIPPVIPHSPQVTLVVMNVGY